jgi:hypothetical protein
MLFIKRQILALCVAAPVLAIAACASEPSGSGTSERSGTSGWWKPPPDYNRGPQIRNNP